MSSDASRLVKPLILLTNDDGVLSPGLQAAAEAVSDLGELLIAAPRYQQTGMGRALYGGDDKGVIEPVRIMLHDRPHRAYGIYASPALAVAHALFELAPRKPALCISGINYGENIGMTLAASGTVGAALEAAVNGVPGIAISRGAPLEYHNASVYGSLDWSIPAKVVRTIAESVLQHGLPPEIHVLNVNVPHTATDDTEIRLTTQSRQRHVYYAPPGERDFSQPFTLPLTSTLDPESIEPDSDVKAFLIDEVVSISPLTGWMAAPIQLDEVSHHLFGT